MNASITSYLPGDLLFYASQPGDLTDAAISAVTSSRFVHVAVAISAVQKIEALFHGVVITPIDQRAVAASWSYVQHAQPLVPQNLARGMQWLQSQVGQMYGLGDIVDALLWKVEHAISIDIEEHYDCSALACQFLMLSGGIDMKGHTNPHVMTPAMLAAFLNVV